MPLGAQALSGRRVRISPLLADLSAIRNASAVTLHVFDLRQIGLLSGSVGGSHVANWKSQPEGTMPKIVRPYRPVAVSTP